MSLRSAGEYLTAGNSLGEGVAKVVASGICMSRPELADCTVLWVAPQSDMTKPYFSSNDDVVSAFSDASKHWAHTHGRTGIPGSPWSP
jgi:hypothetical protein